MKLLFDQNLSPRLVGLLADIFPDASHVSLVSHGDASDNTIWDFARAGGYTIVTRDADFSDLATLRGFPPRVIWLRMGNCTTLEIEAVLRGKQGNIAALDTDPVTAVLTIH